MWLCTLCAYSPYYPSVGHCSVYFSLGLSTTFRLINENQLHTFFFILTAHSELVSNPNFIKMKKIFLLCVVGIMAFASSAYAQVQQEVVYLKNGSVIKGVIVEQVPNESIKIRTNDGSVFAYQMSDVEKITKEELYQTRYNAYNNASRNGAPMRNRTPIEFEVHYRGLVDLGVTAGDYMRLEFTTSHGVQIIPQLFVGAGVGLSYFYEFGSLAMPIFADIRTDILNSKITPFVDFKIGYSPVDVSGLYLSPTLGCRFNKFSIGVSYMMQKAPAVYYDDWSVYNINLGGISFKVGFEF